MRNQPKRRCRKTNLSATGSSDRTVNQNLNVLSNLPTVPEHEKQSKTAIGTAKQNAGTDSWRIGSIILDNYILRKRLGKGGMGTVYLAECLWRPGDYFAVKTLSPAFLDNEERKQAFLTELRTWIDLPDHPNLTACCFFRTVKGKLAIFSEYVDGGSLQQWISSTKKHTLSEILDMAIQIAWGLHATHLCGVVHQDIKPSNILISRDGIAKITDFGLSKACAVPITRSDNDVDETSILVSTQGMTKAYCSPEQCLGLKLNHKTDIWSYGLTLLQMFTGKVNWAVGVLAEQVLKAVYRQSSELLKLPMPPSVTEILYNCFREHQSDRWDSMLTVADRLQAVFEQETGNPYPRSRPEIRQHAIDINYDRTTREGIVWSNPTEWLSKAYKAAGKTEDYPLEGSTGETGSRKARAVKDLEIFQKAFKIYLKLSETGIQEYLIDFGKLLNDMAVLLNHIDDAPGALEHYDRGIALLNKLVYHEKQTQSASQLSLLYNAKGLLLLTSGDFSNALKTFDIAIQTLLFYAEHHGLDVDTEDRLGAYYINMGNVHLKLRQIDLGMTCYERAITIYEKIVYEHNRKDLTNYLSKAYMNKGILLNVTGKYNEALMYCDKAIHARETLMTESEKNLIINEIVGSYVTKAYTLQKLNDYTGAVSLLDIVISIRKRLIEEEGRKDLLNDLARTYNNKASILQDMSNFDDALDLFNRVIDIRETLVYRQGRNDLSGDLARGYMNKALMLFKTENTSEALELFKRSESMFRRIIPKKAPNEFACEYIYCRAYQSIILETLGNTDAAVAIRNETLDSVTAEIQRTGSAELKSFANMLREKHHWPLS